jgi:hypothetical protein
MEAERICATRGARAQFRFLGNGAAGADHNATPPEAVYDCVVQPEPESFVDRH